MDKVLVLTTGGTLDKVYFDALSDYQVGAPVVPGMLRDMNVAFDFDCIEICRKDSLEMTDEDRQAIQDAVAASSASKILISHGTDTMVDSARFLTEFNDRTIVFTGAMQPAAFKDSDALFNVGTAIGALNSAGNGVYVAMSGRVYAADQVFKNYDSKRFEAPVSEKVQ